MDSIMLLRRLHQHRRWVNDGLRSAAAMLKNEHLQRDFLIGQGSIWKSLLHMFAAEYVWLRALQGDGNPVAPGDIFGKLPGNQLGEDRLLNFAELAARWQSLEDEWNHYLETLDDNLLKSDVEKVSSLSGEHQTTSWTDVLLHVCTHAQYTTAQVINMMRHVGVKDLPPSMLISMARSETES